MPFHAFAPWLLALPILVSAQPASAEPAFVFCCDAKNDLYRVMTADGNDYPRFATPAEAVDNAPAGSGVLILADGYPERPTAVEPAVFDRALQKKLRLFVEYPAALPGVEVGAPRAAGVERAVVATPWFGEALPPGRILAVQGLHYVPLAGQSAHLVAARVAGFDTAVFGLPEATHPLLLEPRPGELLVATTCFSRFVRARYAPRDAWQSVWRAVLGWLDPSRPAPRLEWEPVVRPTYAREEPLPADAELQALRRGVQWFYDSKLLVHPDRAAEIERASQGAAPRLPTPPPDAPVGDGSLGILEGPMSVLLPGGGQEQSVVRRGDCHAESAMALAFGGRVLQNSHNTTVARNLLDYYLLTSDARRRERGDPEHGAYGLVAWGVSSPAWYRANYGDDNARLLLGTIATAALNDDDRWDEAAMMCLLANLRTAGQLGFRGDRIDLPELSRQGWKPLFLRRNVNYLPHMEAYLWACYLWAYERTGYELFLDRAKTAIGMTMAQYTDGWTWMNGLAQEKARILLPLAWLVRVDDTPEHRAWLRQAVDGVVALQDASGAIREELGRPGRGRYPPPRSNEAYGTTEASLIQANGDPVADLLYTTNFAFLGLHEAAAAGDRQAAEAADKLAAFLCRVQIESPSQPSLDGGWFRAFDFDRWEHWGSNADHGWGAWAIESGWTQGWIVSVLAMRQMDTSLWDLTRDVNVRRHFPRLREQMLPDEVLAKLEPQTISHAARGATVSLARRPDDLYPGGGGKGLTDGTRGTADHADPAWLGFQGTDLEAVVDLGKSIEVRKLAAGFLRSHRVGVFLPPRVEFAVSDDGCEFREVASVESPEPDRDLTPSTALLEAEIDPVRARFIRVRAVNFGALPEWVVAGARPAWLFVDEIVVNPAKKR